MKQFIRRKEDYLTAKDGVLILILITIYAIISFINLGSFTNPQTFWESTTENKKITLKMNDNQDISKIRIFTGPVTGEYKVYLSDNRVNLGTEVLELKPKAVFAWEDFEVNNKGKYLSIVSQEEGHYIGELQLYDENNNKISIESMDETGNLLIDEADTVPEQISYMNSTYFDEIYHARTAYEHIYKLKPYEWTHPPLGKILISLPVNFLGMNPFAYRLMGNIAGILMIGIIYIFAKRMFKNTSFAFLAGLIMACDGMHFVQTRIATVDSFLVLFVLLAYFFMYEYMRLTQYDPLPKKINKLFWSGLFMGCAIATKWTGAYAAIGLCVLFFYDFIKRSMGLYDKYLWRRQAKWIILWCFLFFVFIPVGIYVLSYIPFFITPNSGVNNFEELIKMQVRMYDYHSKLEATHPFSSAWYTWPLDIRPIWYYDGKNVMEGNVSTIAAFGNPIIWWVGVVGMLYTLKEAFFKRKMEDIFLVVAILASYLPYLFIGRVMFIYHYFPVVPFMMLTVVKLIKDIVAIKNNDKVYRVYCCLLILSFIFFYPVYSGLEVPRWYVMLTAWLPTWGYFR